LEENDVIGINRGQTPRGQPPESLVALYPKEGTFWHEHPFGIVNADWVTPDQREAARAFTQYVLSVPVQQSIMECNFRPPNPDVELGFPFVEENGVTVEGPTTILDVPDAEVILAVQQSWAFVKKQADIFLLIDVSGSMQEEDKIGQAIQAAEAFVNEVDPGNRIGLAVFSDNVRLLVPLGSYETVKDDVLNQIRNLRADGGTELYAAVTQTVDSLNKVEDADRIRAVVLLSDGQDTGDEGITLNDAINAITASSGELNPVIVVPVAYGSNADVSTLNSIARASATSVQSGDPQNILNVLQIISSYF
jgi:Ca-activated chloride channel family protein